MSVQNMEPSAEQFRIASLLDEKKFDAEIEQNIKKVIEFTGCDIDKAAVALYDNDNNVEAACIKIIDSQTEEDSWAKVEKPQKKTEIRDEKDQNRIEHKFERSPQDGGRGRGRGQFRGGRGDYRGGRGGRGKSFGGQSTDRFESRDFQPREFEGGQSRYRGGGRGGRGGQRGGRGGGFRGRSEPPRNQRNYGNHGRDFRPSYREEHNVRAGAGSDSGSDAGWGGDKDNEWEKTESNKVGHGGWQDGPQEFKKSGWDEPDSINKDNWTKASPKQNQNRKVETWNNDMQDNSSGWGNEDSWDEPQVQSKRQPAVSKQSEGGWKETREWDEKEAIQSKRAPPAAHAPPQQSRDESGWNDEEDSSPPNPSRSSNQDASRLASIFPNSVTINDDKVKTSSTSTVKPHNQNHTEEKSIPQNNQLPPGFSKNSEQVLSFGRSPENKPLRRAPPPIRSSIPKQAVEMPSIVNESGSIPQFCFGSFSDERDQEAQQDYKEKNPRFQPQPPQRPTTTATNNTPDQNTDRDHGLYNLGNNILSREKAEKDLRKLLNRPPSSGQSSKSQNPNSSSNSGVVPGLMNPVQPGPGRQTSPPGSANNEIGGISSQSGASTSQPSAPGQGRTPAHRQQQYQPTISTADPMGLTHSYGSHLDSFPGHTSYSSIPGYDMLLNRTHSVSRPEELRPSTQQPIQQQQQYQPYHQTMQPFYGLSTMGYYPVIGGTQRSNAFGQPMSAYQSGGGMGGTTSENSLNRGMRPAPADIATPPPFGPVPNLSPHTYGQPTHPSAPVAFQQLLIPPHQTSVGQQHMNLSHHQQDNRGTRQNI